MLTAILVFVILIWLSICALNSNVVKAVNHLQAIYKNQEILLTMELKK